MSDLELDNFKSLEAIGEEVLEAKALVSLDDKARDKLKAEKVKDGLEKTRLKEVEKKKKKKANKRQGRGRPKRPMCRMR